MIVDTTVLIDLLKKQSAAVSRVKEILEDGKSLRFSTPTIFEFFSGLSKSSKPEEEKIAIRDLLEGQLIVTLDRAASERVGQIEGNLIKDGKQIDTVNAMMAGIALIRDEPVLTRNVKHFEIISGLKVESY